MTPYEINVFMHHANSHDQYPGKDAPIYPATIKMLVDQGLLADSTVPLPPMNGLCSLTKTPKGEAFLTMLCATPIPDIREVTVTEYRDPHHGEWDWERL